MLQKWTRWLGQKFELQLFGVTIHKFRIARNKLTNANALRKSIFKNIPLHLKNQVTVSSIQIFQNELRVPSSQLPHPTNLPIQIVLGNLQHIDLSSKNINSLDNTHIDVFMNLKSLKLTRNKLWFIPDFLTCLNQLEVLVLQNNCLSSLPPNMGDMSALKTLDVSNNPNLKDLPPSLSAIGSLKCIMIAATGLKKLSSAFQAFIQNDGEFVVGETRKEFPPLEDPPIDEFLSKKVGDGRKCDVKRKLTLYWHNKRLERQSVSVL